MPPRHLTPSFTAARRFASPLLSTRAYATAPYPFTKPGQGNQKDPNPDTTSRASSKTPYPFTDPTKPTTPPPPSRPMDPPGPSLDSGEMVAKEATEDNPYSENNPDYQALADYRNSSYTPVPQRVMDGSEDTDTLPAAVLSGAPTELQARTVRIYRPTKPATQSGDWHAHHWQLDWDILAKGHRWENPLMGWQSSGDFMQGTKLNFATKEDAIAFAEKQGYEYFVQEPNERAFRPKAYATQFEHFYGKKLKHVRTK